MERTEQEKEQMTALLRALDNVYSSSEKIRTELFALEMKKSDVDKKMARRESAIYKNIIDAVDEEGKPKYSNENKRKIAKDEALRNDPEYLQIAEDLKDTEYQKKQREIDFDNLKYRARFLHTCIDKEVFVEPHFWGGGQ